MRRSSTCYLTSGHELCTPGSIWLLKDIDAADGKIKPWPFSITIISETFMFNAGTPVERILFQRLDCQLLFARSVSRACSFDCRWNAWCLYSNCLKKFLCEFFHLLVVFQHSWRPSLLFLLKSRKPLKEDTGKVPPAELQSDIPEVDDRKLTKPRRGSRSCWTRSIVVTVQLCKQS
jgi:hypothetical protein